MNHFVFISCVVLLCSSILSAESNDELERLASQMQWQDLFSQGFAVFNNTSLPDMERIGKARTLLEEANKYTDMAFSSTDYHIGLYNIVLAKTYLAESKQLLNSNDLCTPNNYARLLYTSGMQLLKTYLQSPEGSADTQIKSLYAQAENELFLCLLFDYTCVIASDRKSVVEELQSIYARGVIVDTMKANLYKDVLAKEKSLDALDNIPLTQQDIEEGLAFLAKPQTQQALNQLSEQRTEPQAEQHVEMQTEPQVESQTAPQESPDAISPIEKTKHFRAWPLVTIGVAGVVTCTVVILKRVIGKHKNSNKDKPGYENVEIIIP